MPALPSIQRPPQSPQPHPLGRLCALTRAKEANQEAPRSEQVNDAVNKILDALRSNGYEPVLRIEDVEVHGTE